MSCIAGLADNANDIVHWGDPAGLDKTCSKPCENYQAYNEWMIDFGGKDNDDKSGCSGYGV